VYDDLDRPPLRAGALGAALTGPGSPWREIRVLTEAASTNAEVVVAARDGAGEGLVVVAEAQTAGRGRLDRSWSSPPRAGLTFSVLLRPGPAVPVSRWGWLPLLAGVALARSVAAHTGVPARLKWPNDLLLGSSMRKGAGVLAEVVGDAVAVGIGLNVTTTAAELPTDRPATSLAVEGSPVLDRDPLLRAVLRALGADYRQWCAVGGEPQPLLAAYRPWCATLGQPVRLELPGGQAEEGVAVDLDGEGRLVVERSDGTVVSWSAGDVVHLR
jgi:BirA family biotin operon repressor/biotin-[acetyl-CoA-carboxylase] ligase